MFDDDDEEFALPNWGTGPAPPHLVALRAERFRKGLDLWTGEPLAGADRVENAIVGGAPLPAPPAPAAASAAARARFAAFLRELAE